MTHSIYLKNAKAAGSNFGSLQFDGAAPAAATTTSGWTVAKSAAGTFSKLAYGVERASNTFASADPMATPAAPNNVFASGAGDCFRTENPITGTFASASWTFKFAARSVTAAGGTGAMVMRLWRGANADGSGATQITAAELTGTTTAAFSTTADAISTVTWAPGAAVTFNNEYLFVQLEWKIVTAGSGTTVDVLLRVGSNAVITAPAMTLSDIVTEAASPVETADATISIAAKIYNLAETETANGVDAQSATIVWASSVAESVAAAENASATSAWSVARAEAGAVFDTVSAQISIAAAQAETAIVADTATAAALLAGSGSESGTALDGASATWGALAAVAEAVNAMEVAAATGGVAVSLSDTLSAASTQSASISTQALVAESAFALDEAVADLPAVAAASVTEATTPGAFEDAVLVMEAAVIELASAADEASAIEIDAVIETMADVLFPTDQQDAILLAPAAIQQVELVGSVDVRTLELPGALTVLEFVGARRKPLQWSGRR